MDVSPWKFISTILTPLLLLSQRTLTHEFNTTPMDATQVFLYAASTASIIILVLVAIAFYFLYQTLMRIQSFFTMAESMLAGLQLAKTGTALTGYKVLRSALNIFRKGGGE